MKTPTVIALSLLGLAALAVVAGTVLSALGQDAVPAWGALTLLIGLLGGQQLPAPGTETPKE